MKINFKVDGTKRSIKVDGSNSRSAIYILSESAVIKYLQDALDKNLNDIDLKIDSVEFNED